MIIKHSSEKPLINVTEHASPKQGFAVIFLQTDKDLPFWELKRDIHQIDSSTWRTIKVSLCQNLYYSSHRDGERPRSSVLESSVPRKETLRIQGRWLCVRSFSSQCWFRQKIHGCAGAHRTSKERERLCFVSIFNFRFCQIYFLIFRACLLTF